MSAAGNWCLIESDPGVFTELIGRFGVRGLEVEELYSLDDARDPRLGTVYGLIFLFKIPKTRDTTPAAASSSGGGQLVAAEDHGLFFAHQVISNACATQAILSVLLNLDTTSKNVELGKELSEFKLFASELPSDMKGLAISNCENIRIAHNSFGRASPFEHDPIPDRQDDDQDSFHFIAYIPHEGRLYEMDGLQESPICHGAIDGTDWLHKAQTVLNQRIEKYASNEVRFNLMAVIKDRRVTCKEELDKLSKSRTDGGMSMRQQQLTLELEELEKNHARYKRENARRRHNFIPMIFELLTILAETNPKALCRD